MRTHGIGFWLAVGVSGLAWAAAKQGQATADESDRALRIEPPTAAAPRTDAGAPLPKAAADQPLYFDSNAGAKAERAGHELKNVSKEVAGAVSDGWITSKVKTKLMADDRVEARSIDVDTAKRIVSLKGHVGSEAERARAVEIAKGTDGVWGVLDQLQVVPSPPSSK